MRRTVQDCMRAADALAEGQKQYKDSDTGYTGIDKARNTQDTGSLVSSQEDKSNQYNGIPRNDRTKIWRKVTTDPIFKKGLDWGMNPSYLTTLCLEYGEYFVRDVIDRVGRRHDTAFKGKEPVAQQRGKLCGFIIKQDGVKKYA